MNSQSPEAGDSLRREEPMSLEQVARPVGEPTETPLDGQVEDQQKVESQTPDPARPGPLKLFHARWEYLKPGLEFLAGS